MQDFETVNQTLEITFRKLALEPNKRRGLLLQDMFSKVTADEKMRDKLQEELSCPSFKRSDINLGQYDIFLYPKTAIHSFKMAVIEINLPK